MIKSLVNTIYINDIIFNCLHDFDNNKFEMLGLKDFLFFDNLNEKIEPILLRYIKETEVIKKTIVIKTIKANSSFFDENGRPLKFTIKYVELFPVYIGELNNND